MTLKIKVNGMSFNKTNCSLCHWGNLTVFLPTARKHRTAHCMPWWFCGLAGDAGGIWCRSQLPDSGKNVFIISWGFIFLFMFSLLVVFLNRVLACSMFSGAI